MIVSAFKRGDRVEIWVASVGRVRGIVLDPDYAKQERLVLVRTDDDEVSVRNLTQVRLLSAIELMADLA